MGDARLRPLSVDEQVALMQSIAKALARMVDARAEWIAYIEQHGRCYCGNPFRAHIDHAEEWAGFHLACPTNWPWRGEEPNPTKIGAALVQGSSEPQKDTGK